MKRVIATFLGFALLIALTAPSHAVTVATYKSWEQSESSAYFLGALEMAMSIYHDTDPARADCIKTYFSQHAKEANKELWGLFSDPDLQQHPPAGGMQILIIRHCGEAE